MPRYCEACRTFITSRDSFKRTATLSRFTLTLLSVAAPAPDPQIFRGCSPWPSYVIPERGPSRFSLRQLS
jgi:hypothetical protein